MAISSPPKTATRTAITVHPTAIVHPKAQLAAGVTIGPFSTVGAHVVIGRGTTVGTRCVIDGRTTIGAECQIFTGAVIGSIPQDLKYHGEPSQLIIGDRNCIREYVTMNLGTREGGNKTLVGDDNLIMAYAHVAHDCIIGNRVVMANNGTLAGHIEMHNEAILGGLSGIHQFARVGRLAIVGGHSKVTQDIPPFAACDGHPARIYGLNLIGLRRANIPIASRTALKQAFRLLLQSQLTLQHALKRIAHDVPPCPEVTLVQEFVRTTKRGISRSV
jgi:UDP-N-acetylglucosamine acyltransferase